MAFGELPAGVYSITTFMLLKQGGETKIVFDQAGFSVRQAERLAEGWHVNYLQPTTKVLAGKREMWLWPRLLHLISRLLTGWKTCASLVQTSSYRGMREFCLQTMDRTARRHHGVGSRDEAKSPLAAIKLVNFRDGQRFWLATQQSSKGRFR